MEALLRQQCSADQAAGYLHARGVFAISHENIYRPSELRDRSRSGSLHLHLLGAHKQKCKRYGGCDRRGRLAGKRHLSQRPALMEARRQPGRWEIDMFLGSTGACVGTLVERKSGYLLVGKMRAPRPNSTGRPSC